MTRAYAAPEQIAQTAAGAWNGRKGEAGLREAAMLAVAGILGIVGSCATLWTEHHTIIELPAPGGPYPVGRLTQVWSHGRKVDLTGIEPTAAPVQSLQSD
jgi:hypothetical protein